MQNLTSSDISFLLCTILSASSPLKQPATSGFLPPLRLTLKTSYGLQIELSPSHPSRDLSISLGGTNKPSPPAALKPTSKQTRPPPLELLPPGPLFHPAPLPSPPSSPPAYQPPPRPSRGILHLSPCFRTSTFLWHSSGSFSTKSNTPKPINESLLEPRYGPAFYSAYLDWVDRAEALENINLPFNHCLESFYARSCGGGRATESQSDIITVEMRDSPDDELQEGERILWMVEGVLLAAWLALQGDVEGVEYAPWDRRGARLCDDGTTREKIGKAEQGYPYYWLDKRSAGEVVKALLRDVGV